MTIRSTPGVLAILCLLLAALPVAVRAADADEPYKVRVNLAFFAGIQRYSMSDVNDVIDDANASFQADPILSAAGLKLDPLQGGRGLGAGIRVWPRENIVIAADYQRLTGSSGADVPLSSQPGAPSLNVEVTTPAQTMGLTAGYFFYRPWKPLHVGVGAGAAYYLSEGKSEYSFPGAREKIELHGDGIGFHALLLGDLRVSDTIHFEAAVGYRRAKTGDLENQGVKVPGPGGSPIKADYSGLVTRVGIDVPFGPVK